MALSTAKLNTLNRLINYLAALYKGQLQNAGGDIRMGDLFGNFRLVAAGSSTINASPTSVTIGGILTTDLPIAVLDTDETGGGAVPAVCITAAIAADGVLDLTPKAGPANNNAVAKYFVFRAQS